jgi:hypothetical protein
MRTYLEADAAYRRYKAEVFMPAFNKQRAFEEAHGVEVGRPGWCERRDALTARFGSAHEVPSAIDDEFDRLVDVASDLECAVMETPAPDLAALRWKLDRLLEPDDPDASTPCWNKDYVRQTIEDYQRLLG